MNLLFSAIIFCSFLSCGDNSEKEEEGNTEKGSTSNLVINVQIPDELAIYEGQSVTIGGKSFLESDKLEFKSASYQFDVTLMNVTKYEATFVVPQQIKDGEYTITLSRGNEKQELGKTVIILTFDTSVPDKDGATIKGVVHCEGEAVKGVRVSDGIITTTTDNEGRYWLPSEKYHGYVFVVTPSGYEPMYPNKATPGFWATLTFPNTICEQHNFELQKRQNNKHIIIAGTGIHMAKTKMNDEQNKFRNGFLVDAPALIQNYGTTPSYALILGDMSFDLYWYAHDFNILDYKNMVTSFPVPMFHVMGNHDNDPYISNDFGAEAMYKKVFGPTYYSINLGKVHYIVLDNNVYINNGASQGTIGDRSIQKYVEEKQLNWLKEDLASITDKSAPIIVALHCYTHVNNVAGFGNVSSFSPTSKRDEFMACFDGFSDVHFLTGHGHFNANLILSPSIIEHTTAAICETWWWASRLSGVPICKDGSPAGYGVYEIDGTDIEWYYKGIAKDKSYQFRTYDMNTVKPVFEETENKEILAKFSGRGNGNDYESIGNNVVLLNIWNYDPLWKISVKEEGISGELSCTRTLLRDPLHTICYELPRWKTVDQTISNDFASNLSAHMFVIQTNSATSTIYIEVTDRFGNIYKETMTRPKEFSTSIF